MDTGIVSALTKWLFGLPPESVRWVHVVLALVMSSMVWLPPLARLYWHVRRERFIRSATPEQLRAYLAEPPKPPSIGGPAAMVLAILLAGTLLRGSPPLPVESASVVESVESTSVAPPPQHQTQTHTSTSAVDQDSRRMSCYPSDVSTEAEPEKQVKAKTCCKGKCEPGSRCNPRTCECETRVFSPSSALRFVDVKSAEYLIEAGSAMDQDDWAPTTHDWAE